MSNTTPSQMYTVATGTSSTDKFITFIAETDPSTENVNFPIQKRWYNSVNEKEWILTGFTSSNGVIQANWQPITGDAETGILGIIGNSGGTVSANSSNNINFVGDGTSINIIGNPSTNTLTANVILPSTPNSVLYSQTSSIAGVAPGTSGQVLTSQGPSSPPSWTTPASSSQTLTPDSGAAVAPISGTIQVTGYPTGTTSAIKGIKTYNGSTNKFEIADMTQVTPYVVGKDANLYNFTTIQSAINAAETDGATAGVIKLVYVTPGVYTEDLLMKTGVYLVGATTSHNASAVKVVGNSSYQSAVIGADLIVQNIEFSNTGANTLSFGGSSAGKVTFVNVLVDGDYGPGVLLLADNVFDVSFYNSTISATGSGTCLGLESGIVNFYYCRFTSEAYGSTFSPSTAANFYYCDIQDSYVVIEATISFYHCIVNSDVNVCVNLLDSTGSFYYTSFISNATLGNFIIGTGATVNYTAISAEGTAKNIQSGSTLNGDALLAGNLSFDGGNTTLSSDGQLWIGKTGASPAPATLTAGSGISITNGSNSITIAATGSTGGVTWSTQNASFSAASQNGYVVTATATATLPTSAPNGTIISFIAGVTSGNLTIQCASGDKISINNTLSAITGSAVNTTYGNSVNLVYISSLTTWFSTGGYGNWTVT